MKKILIVDDEKPIVRALELKLNNAGFETQSAYDGEEAITCLSKEKFSLILLDLVMPKKDGFSVLKEMKENNIKIPVIVLSNLGQNEDLDRARNLGARGYFIKADTPIAEVVKNIKKILKNSK